MNINKLPQPPPKFSLKKLQLKAAAMPSYALYSPGLPTPNPEVPLLFIAANYLP